MLFTACAHCLFLYLVSFHCHHTDDDLGKSGIGTLNLGSEYDISDTFISPNRQAVIYQINMLSCTTVSNLVCSL